MLTLLLLAASPCADDVAATVKWTKSVAAAVVDDGVMLSPDTDLQPAKAGKVQFGRGSVLVSLSRATLVDGAPVEAEGLQKGIEKARASAAEQAKVLGLETAPALIMAVSREVQWSRVAAAVSAGEKAGFGSATFIFASELQPEAPSPSSIDDEIARVMKLPVEKRAEAIGDLSRKVNGACPAVKAAVLGGTAEDIGGFLNRIAEALPACSCDFDRAAFRALLWVTMTPHAQTAVTVKLGGKGAVVRESARTPWSSASAALLALKPAQSVRLEVKP